MNEPRTLVSRRRSGVFWVGPPPEAAELQHLAAAAGWDFASIDGGAVRDKASLLAAMAGALGFPKASARNWDALEDTLRDLSWRRGAGTLLLWAPIDPLDHGDPETLEVALDILREVADWWKEEGRPFLAFLGGARRPAVLGGARGRRA